MKYTEVSVKFPSEWSLQDKEVLMAYLAEEGFESFSDTEDGFNGYIISKQYNPEIFLKLPGNLNLLPPPEVCSAEIADCNWNEVWESNFSPVIIGDKLSVRASFHPKPENVVFDIVINPKMSFGTGHHETTSLVARIMMGMEIKDRKLLDMGCGTGILAILAKMMGAEEVWAIDNDEWAYNNAVENCATNNCSEINVFCGDAHNIPDIKFDIIIANINRNILLNDLKYYMKSLKKKGAVVLSGFFEEDIQPVKAEALSLGLEFLNFINDGKWVACSFVYK